MTKAPLRRTAGGAARRARHPHVGHPSAGPAGQRRAGQAGGTFPDAGVKPGTTPTRRVSCVVRNRVWPQRLRTCRGCGDRNGTAMTSGGGPQVLAGHGDIHGPGHQAVLADTNGDALIYHYYANNGASLLGINLHGRRGRNAHAPLTGSDTVPGAALRRPARRAFGGRAVGGTLSVLVSGA